MHEKIKFQVPIHRFKVFHRIAGYHLLIESYLMIGHRFGKQVLADGFSGFVSLLMEMRRLGFEVHRTKHCVQQRLVDGPNGWGFMTLWNWNICLVVSLKVPLPRSSAMRFMASHCSGLQTLPGILTRTMNE